MALDLSGYKVKCSAQKEELKTMKTQLRELKRAHKDVVKVAMATEKRAIKAETKLSKTLAAQLA